MYLMYIFICFNISLTKLIGEYFNLNYQNISYKYKNKSLPIRLLIFFRFIIKIRRKIMLRDYTSL